MKHHVNRILAAGIMLTGVSVWAQETDEDAFYAAEQACSEQAMEDTDRDYYEAYQECMRQRGFDEEQTPLYDEDE